MSIKQVRPRPASSAWHACPEGQGGGQGVVPPTNANSSKAMCLYMLQFLPYTHTSFLRAAAVAKAGDSEVVGMGEWRRCQGRRRMGDAVDREGRGN